MDAAKIEELVERGESTTLEWKESNIVNDGFKLARSMTAMANNEGGILLIGVRDDGTIEGIKGGTKYEEKVMNIASDICVPPVRPSLERVMMTSTSDVYVLVIPKRRQSSFHAVRGRGGLVYFTRVGPTVREISPDEFGTLVEEGVEEEPYSAEDMILLRLSERIVTKIAARWGWSTQKALLIPIAIGIPWILVGSLLILPIGGSQSLLSSQKYSPWAYFAVFLMLVFGVFMAIAIPSITYETRCRTCNSPFSFKKTKIVILDKRKVSESVEEEKIRVYYKCDVCGHEDNKLRYRRYNISED